MVIKRTASILNVAGLAIASPVAVNDGTDDLAALAVANLTGIIAVHNLLTVLIDLAILLAF